MHIPDGFLSTEVLVSTNAISLICFAYSIKKINKYISPERIPLIGLSAAFIFTIQLLSFPVPFGTSVHLQGSLLVCILLGPATGFLIIVSALVLQTLLFQHGGILSLGANAFNIGFVGCFIGYLIYKLFKKFLRNNLSAGISAFLTIILSAIFCIIELYLSGKVELKKAMTFMIGTYIFLGIIEGVATSLILFTISKIRKDLISIKKI